jgi:hypothetical protein
MAKALPDEISAAREQALIEGLSESIITPLAQQLIKHVGERFATILPQCVSEGADASQRKAHAPLDIIVRK